MSIPTESYEAIYKQYAAAILWMSGLGIKITSGRTSHYERILRHWKEAYKTAPADEVVEIFPDFVSSMFEIFDFVRIYNALHGTPANQLEFVIEKLQKGVNGPIHAVEETAESTTARNFLFEATVTALAHRPDQGVEAILDAKSDTGIRINGRKIWVECKRVTTIGKIESNVRKASSQLEALLSREVGSGHRGIVALDISKILNLGDHIMVARNDDALLASIDRMMDQFIKQHSQVWQRIFEKRHRKIIGIVIRFAFMGSSEQRKLLVHASQWAINPRKGISEGDEQIQIKLVNILASAPR